jgi:hypothetical protein
MDKRQAARFCRFFDIYPHGLEKGIVAFRLQNMR